MNDKTNFQKVFPFTTEDISGYIQLFQLSNKNILTVGSSGDQAFNSLLCGARKVTIFDINKNTIEFIKAKRNLILTTPREQFYDKVLLIKKFNYSTDIFSKNDIEKMNIYLKDDESYYRLREILRNKEIEVKVGDLFKDLNNLENNKYDYIFLSNVLQYLRANPHDIGKKVFQIYEQLSEHLNENGIIQLYYLYGSLYPRYCWKILDEFLKYNIIIEKSKCENSSDAILTIKKQKKKTI